MVTAAPATALDRGRLRALPLLAATTDADLEDLLRRSVVVTAGVGEALVEQGDPSDHAYVIVSGTASVVAWGEARPSLGAGDLFGETAMVAGGVRTATVRATTPMELLRLDAQSVATATGTQTIAWSMLQALLDRIAGDGGPHAEGVDPASIVAATTSGSAGGAGEFLSIVERVVVAPSVGVFRACASADATNPGDVLATGQLLGFVDALGDRAEVRSPFAGYFMGMLALDGERVRTRQPIAWLRTL